MMKASDMTRAHHTLPPNLPPLGLRREAAAEFVCISPSKFDSMVADGRMPKPMHIDGVVCWDVEELTTAWRRLRETKDTDATAGNPWDIAMGIEKR